LEYFYSTGIVSFQSGSYGFDNTLPNTHMVSMQTTSPSMLITVTDVGGRDLLWRCFYWLAYRLLRIFWFLFRPKGRGTLVAIRYQGRLLLVKNGYRRGYNLPGGSCRSGERARAAAVREVEEEVGIRLVPNQLCRRGTVVSRRNHLRDHCTYFEVQLEKAPSIRIDGREVVAAVLARPEALSTYPLAHSLKTYLKCYRPAPGKAVFFKTEPGYRRL
jgi:8-oxo-dGTP pyrophosphatase MutT (NUDIX family)